MTILITTHEEYTNATTDKAYALWDGEYKSSANLVDKKIVWAPKSLVRRVPGGFEMPEWLAKKLGLM